VKGIGLMGLTVPILGVFEVSWSAFTKKADLSRRAICECSYQIGQANKKPAGV
jgi:hypothetical protein